MKIFNNTITWFAFFAGALMDHTINMIWMPVQSIFNLLVIGLLFWLALKKERNLRNEMQSMQKRRC